MVSAHADTYREQAEALVARMTVGEKAALASGKDFWTTKANERLGIPSIWLADGPHGLRKAPTSQGGGLGTSLPATSFPTASALASSWDRALIGRVGETLGTEAQAQGVQILLGPGANIKRSPLGGRNFEYFSEDPVLSGEIAAAFINGVQSKGVGTSLKHYAVNNQETARMYIDAQVGERALREIYLAGFEIAVKKAQPWTIMSAYNRLNGVYVSEHERLLDTILKDEWGFKGLIVSDWGAVTDRVASIRGGLHLEMPGLGPYTDGTIVEAIANGTLDEARLDELTTDTLRIILMASDKAAGPGEFDAQAHHAFARQVAAQSAVLLKNDNGTLPLSRAKDRRIAVVGAFAQTPRYQGAGSSQVVPTQIDKPIDALREAADGMTLTYARGYKDDGSTTDELIAEAVSAAKAAETVVVFAGVPAGLDVEGRDRPDITLPEGHDDLITALSETDARVVVVLMNGSAVAMPWIDDVDAVLEAWLAGQAGAGAIADLLTGAANPSGKLAETFPMVLSDTPTFYSFPGDYRAVKYGEGVFVGYRHYDISGIEPLFPFGHGLSYTSFEYEDLEVSDAEFAAGEEITVRVSIRNTGDRAGQEVVQLYVSDLDSAVLRPVRELRDFAKVALEPGESETVSFTLDRRDFAYYHEGAQTWAVDPGEVAIEIGASSRDIRVSETVTITQADEPRLVYDRFSPIIDVLQTEEGRTVMEPIVQAAFGVSAEMMMSDDPSNPIALYLAHVPIIKLVNWSQGQFTLEMIDGLIAQLNARP